MQPSHAALLCRSILRTRATFCLYVCLCLLRRLCPTLSPLSTAPVKSIRRLFESPSFLHLLRRSANLQPNRFPTLCNNPPHLQCARYPEQSHRPRSTPTMKILSISFLLALSSLALSSPVETNPNKDVPPGKCFPEYEYCPRMTYVREYCCHGNWCGYVFRCPLPDFWPKDKNKIAVCPVCP